MRGRLIGGKNVSGTDSLPGRLEIMQMSGNHSDDIVVFDHLPKIVIVACRPFLLTDVFEVVVLKQNHRPVAVSDIVGEIAREPQQSFVPPACT
jgi:hypothetical protein